MDKIQTSQLQGKCWSRDRPHSSPSVRAHLPLAPPHTQQYTQWPLWALPTPLRPIYHSKWEALPPACGPQMWICQPTGTSMRLSFSTPEMKVCKSLAFTGFTLSLIAGKPFHLLHPCCEDGLAVCLLRRGMHAHVRTQPAETSLPYLFPQTIEKLDQLVSNIQAVSSTQNKQRTSILPMLIASGKRDTKSRVFKRQDNVICEFVQKGRALHLWI